MYTYTNIFLKQHIIINLCMQMGATNGIVTQFVCIIFENTMIKDNICLLLSMRFDHKLCMFQ